MPLYDYKCNSCSTEFEARVAISKREHATCTKCGKEADKQLSFNRYAYKLPGDWTKGVWEDLDLSPVYIKDRQHLVQEMKKRNFFHPAIIKHKSQGKGLEYRE